MANMYNVYNVNRQNSKFISKGTAFSQIANAETASVVADLRLIEKAQNDLSNVVKAFVA